ncbi:hypothetical protein C8R44DRAFT_861534 [Mycena epipterygia]|nr:hypothetical protein C8R44DRAFT_861534 [Mycena epipterygia]
MSDPHHPHEAQALLQNSDPTTQNFVATVRERLDALRAQEAALNSRRAGLLALGTSLMADASALHAQHHDMTASLQARLTALITEMSAFQEEAKEENSSLQENLRTLEQNIRAHNSILPAVRTPPEILCEIFRWTSPYNCMRKVDVYRVPTAPWWLTHICQHWRAAARGDGYLWCHIVIDTTRAPHGMRESCYPLAALETQLELSATVPLDISFYSRSYHNHDVALLWALVRHSNRWERLYISASALPAISRNITGNLAQLHHLQITPSTQEYPTEFRNIFIGAPQLREALLPGLPVFSLPWHQLTRLRVESEAESLLEILPKLHNIVNCEITVIGDDTSMPSASDTNVVLPHIQQLVLDVGWFSRFLETPKLESLGVSWSIDSVPQFLRRSQCHLKALKLHSSFSKLATLRELLRCVPTLSHLELDFCIDGDTPSEAQHALIRQYFHAMKAIGSSTPLCPKPTSMDVIFPGDMTPKPVAEGYESCCEMVESRWNLPTSMRSLMRVHIFPDEFVSYSVRHRFDAMRRAGLDVNRLYTRDEDEVEGVESDSSANAAHVPLNPRWELE